VSALERQTCWSERAARDSNPNRQIRSLPLIVRLVPCGPSVLLTSQNLVLPVRLVSCGPPVGLSSSVKNSVNDGPSRVEHQVLSDDPQGSRMASVCPVGSKAATPPAALDRPVVSQAALPTQHQGSADPMPEVASIKPSGD
jgi:hypothetical protein